jgi:hypoxanthine phosphoribosyltransferase
MKFEEIAARYKKDGFKRLTWNEYESVLQILVSKVQDYIKENNLKIDVIVPILRGGSFPGVYLAYKLKLIRIVPVQYKYFTNENSNLELRKLLDLPENISLSEKPTILIVENNHCFGTTGVIVTKNIRERFSNATIIYVASWMDYSFQENKYADTVIYGKLTNETKMLSEEEAVSKGLETPATLFPWENEEEEWSTVGIEKFEYNDVNTAKEVSVVSEEIKE